MTSLFLSALKLDDDEDEVVVSDGSGANIGGKQAHHQGLASARSTPAVTSNVDQQKCEGGLVGRRPRSTDDFEKINVAQGAVEKLQVAVAEW